MIVTDARGRKIEVRSLGPGDMLDLVAAAEGNSLNGGWLMFAMRVCSAVTIDDVPVPRPGNVAEVKELADRLGFDGLAAVDQGLKAEPDPVEQAKN